MTVPVTLFGLLVALRARKNALIAWFWLWLVNHLPRSGQHAVVNVIPKFKTFSANLNEKPVSCNLFYIQIYARDELVGGGTNNNPQLYIALHFAQCTASSLYNHVLRFNKVTAAPDMVELHLFGDKLHPSGHRLKLRKTDDGFEYNVTTNQVHSTFYKPALCDQIDLEPFAKQDQAAESPAMTTLAELEALMNG